MAFREATLCENYFVKNLKEKGWNFIPSDELERDNYEEPLLIPNLVRALEKINRESVISDEEINRVVNELKLHRYGN